MHLNIEASKTASRSLSRSIVLGALRSGQLARVRLADLLDLFGREDTSVRRVRAYECGKVDRCVHTCIHKSMYACIINQICVHMK
jgi:hypothetical protein